MKAALEAWGAGSNLFHQGLAKETDEPVVVAATMAKPGVVLKRAVGSRGRFSEHSDLPDELATGKPEPRARRQAETERDHRRARSTIRPRATPHKNSSGRRSGARPRASAKQRRRRRNRSGGRRRLRKRRPS